MSEVMHPPGPDAVLNRCEDLWDFEEYLPVNSTPSLTNLALLQPQASFDHLHLLHQLAETIYVILCLGLRRQSLTPLFKSAVSVFSDSVLQTSLKSFYS